MVEARRRLAGYEARLGAAFPLQAELDLKRAELARIEADLAENNTAPAKITNESSRKAVD
jgi:hypothetical protein